MRLQIPSPQSPEIKIENFEAKEALKESEELVVHFVSSPEKFEDPAKRNFR